LKRLVLIVALLLLVLITGCAQIPVASTAPVIITFESDQALRTAGQAVTLLWNVTGASSVRIEPGLGSVAVAGSQAITPEITTSYVLTASNNAGVATRSVAVIVASPALPIIVSFGIGPSAITAGETATAMWNVTGATSLTIDQGIGTVPAAGTRLVSPDSTTTYTLTATNDAGSVSVSEILTLTPAAQALPVIVYFEVYPPVTDIGGPVMIKWKVTGATTVRIDPAIGEVSSVDQLTFMPNMTTTYTLTATNSAGSVSDSGTVIVSGYYMPLGYNYP